MINVNAEKAYSLSTQNVYDIIGFAMQNAEDNGFLNSFVFERALYLYAALILCPDRKDEIATLISVSPLTAWETLVEDGTIESMIKDYQPELDFLAENGKNWYEEYSEYAHSARGLLDTIQDFASDIVEQAMNQFQGTLNNAELQQALALADKWGMNRPEPGTPIEAFEPEPFIEEESLFNQ